MDITNYYENAYEYVPICGDESTGYHHHMISGVAFSTQIHLQVCLLIIQLQRWFALMIIQILLHVPKL